MAVVTIIAKAELLDPVGSMYMKKLVNATEKAFADGSVTLSENEELENAGKKVRMSVGRKGWEVLLR